MDIKLKQYLVGGCWWFGTFFIFPYIGNVIIPTDSHIFQRGRYTTNQIWLSLALWNHFRNWSCLLVYWDLCIPQRKPPPKCGAPIPRPSHAVPGRPVPLVWIPMVHRSFAGWLEENHEKNPIWVNVTVW